jgi:site-specific recombinase XerD
MNGRDMLPLKVILGHSSMKMVERYAHLASAHIHRQVKNLDTKFNFYHLFATSRKTA